MLADQVLARQPVGVEIALDGGGDRLLVRLRAERRLLLHVVQSQISSKSSTNFQNLATPPAQRTGFCEFTARSSEQCGEAPFSEVAGINMVNLRLQCGRRYAYAHRDK